jgi:hypothetical protein
VNGESFPVSSSPFNCSAIGGLEFDSNGQHERFKVEAKYSLLGKSYISSPIVKDSKTGSEIHYADGFDALDYDIDTSKLLPMQEKIARTYRATHLAFKTQDNHNVVAACKTEIK